MNMIGRGLEPAGRLARSARFALRVARVHFRGDVGGWLGIDRDVGAEVAAAVRAGFASGRPPRAVFCALTGIDKTSHSRGHGAPGSTTRSASSTRPSPSCAPTPSAAGGGPRPRCSW
jgi:hypothetical protein